MDKTGSLKYLRRGLGMDDGPGLSTQDTVGPEMMIPPTPGGERDGPQEYSRRPAEGEPESDAARARRFLLAVLERIDGEAVHVRIGQRAIVAHLEDLIRAVVREETTAPSLLAQARAAWGRDVFAEHHGDGLWRVHQSHREYVVGMGKTEDDALRSAIEGAPAMGEG